MIVYQKTKDEFINDVRNNIIEFEVDEKVRMILHKKTPQSEFSAWRNSMLYMRNVLDDERIPSDVKVAIEYRLPMSNKRVDIIISGKDEDEKDNAVIIELKQWQKVEKVDTKDAIVKTVLGHGYHETTHPSYQAWSYARLLYDYNEDIRRHDIKLEPCAYLHNYILANDDDLLAPCYRYYIDRAPVFTRFDTQKLADFIAKYIKKGNADVLYHIENGKILPSKSLQDSMTSLLKGNKEFTLIDDQKVIYEKAIAIATDVSEDKKVYIIHGGPGTGKSVLAINLLVAILNKGLNTIYVTKNQAPREVYRKKLTNGKYRKAYVDNLFKGSGSFYDADDDTFDCIITDEAHRLNEKSGLFKNLGENQVKEIIKAAKTSIFFIDDHQQVTTGDIGSTDEIKRWSRYHHAKVYEDTLSSQFRCSGSDSYLSWLDNVLEINDQGINGFDHDYDIRIFDTPEEVRDIIYQKNLIDNKSRMVAGYCWEWISNGKNDPGVYDIVIDDFKASWNLGSTNTWAIDDDSIKEIGCIHTAQGLEFDYVGVIIGEDMRYEDGHIVTDFFKRARTDQSIKGLRGMYREDKEKALALADKIIKNTYRTLLTRGIKGCYVYCVDKGLSDYLKACLKEHYDDII